MARKTPQQKESDLRAVVKANGVDMTKPCIVAVRGYYLNSMGKKGVNDRGIYDDAIFIITPFKIYRFQANTDPSRYRNGKGYSSGKGMACLKEGIHIYGTGLHKGTKAFRQCEKFTVMRDSKDGPYAHCGLHGINLHSGGIYSTSSLGCQTVPKDTWAKFRSTMYHVLKKHNASKIYNDRRQKVRSFPYILINEHDFLKYEETGDTKHLIVSRRYLENE